MAQMERRMQENPDLSGDVRQDHQEREADLLWRMLQVQDRLDQLWDQRFALFQNPQPAGRWSAQSKILRFLGPPVPPSPDPCVALLLALCFRSVYRGGSRSSCRCACMGSGTHERCYS